MGVLGNLQQLTVNITSYKAYQRIHTSQQRLDSPDPSRKLIKDFRPDVGLQKWRSFARQEEVIFVSVYIEVPELRHKGGDEVFWVKRLAIHDCHVRRQ